MAYGGEERFTVSLAHWLAREGHDATVMGTGFASIKTKHISKVTLEEDDKEIGRRKQKNIKTLYPPYFVYLISRFVISLLWIIKMLCVNIRSPITLIHAQDTGYSGLAAVISGKLLRIPVVISSHGIRHKTLESSIHGGFNKIFLKIEYKLDLFTIKNADGIIVINPSLERYFKKIGDPKKIDFIPIPIKLKNFEFSQTNRDMMRRDLGIDENIKVIGFVGRLAPEKNLLTLFTSFANVVQDDPLTKLVVVGTGPEERKLKEYVGKTGIEDKVIFCGVRHDINQVLSGFDVFVLPSYTEGLSTALIEAMTSGRAIICSDIPGNHELVTHNQEALLVNPYHTQELQKTIQLLCTNELLRLELGNNAKIRASQYDEDLIFPKILQYYKGYLDKENKNVSNEIRYENLS